MAKTDLTCARLKERLNYDPHTGVFTYRFSHQKLVAGGIAGKIHYKTGYRQIQVDGKLYSAHRLAWLYITGEWPQGHVDHKNRNRDDNWFLNLRDVPRQVNNENMGFSPRNTSGHKGVTFDKRMRRWKAGISVRGKTIYLGAFDRPEDAAVAFEAASLKYRGHQPVDNNSRFC